MSHLHFTSTENYRNRVIQLGEQPGRVFNVGAIGIENIKHVPLFSKEELEESLDFELSDKSLLVTYHPVTLENATAVDQCTNLLQSLEQFVDYRVVFTLPNSDTDGRIIIKLIHDYVAEHPKRSIAFTSLGMKRYLSALRYVTAVVGNSSSGIIEVPSFGIPTLNIGDRQKGRIAADSILHCSTTEQAITEGLRQILSPSFIERVKHITNPYEKEGTTNAILQIIKSCDLKILIQKSFYNIS